MTPCRHDGVIDLLDDDSEGDAVEQTSHPQEAPAGAGVVPEPLQLECESGLEFASAVVRPHAAAHPPVVIVTNRAYLHVSTSVSVPSGMALEAVIRRCAY